MEKDTERLIISTNSLIYALAFALLEQPQIDRAKLLADIETRLASLPHIDTTIAEAFLTALRAHAQRATARSTSP